MPQAYPWVMPSYFPGALRLRMQDTESGKRKTPLQADDPRNIGPNIAPVPAPAKEELLAAREKKSRFQ